jgi:hypothetical protein
MIPVRITITAKAASSKEETFPIPLALPSLRILMIYRDWLKTNQMIKRLRIRQKIVEIMGKKNSREVIDFKYINHPIIQTPLLFKIISLFYLSNTMREKSSNSLRLTLKFKSDT